MKSLLNVTFYFLEINVFLRFLGPEKRKQEMITNLFLPRKCRVLLSKFHVRPERL